MGSSSFFGAPAPAGGPGQSRQRRRSVPACQILAVAPAWANVALPAICSKVSILRSCFPPNVCFVLQTPTGGRLGAETCSRSAKVKVGGTGPARFSRSRLGAGRSLTLSLALGSCPDGAAVRGRRRARCAGPARPSGKGRVGNPGQGTNRNGQVDVPSPSRPARRPDTSRTRSR